MEQSKDGLRGVAINELAGNTTTQGLHRLTTYLSSLYPNATIQDCPTLQAGMIRQITCMAKERIHGRCRLCHNQDWLVDSHIIPNFHYKPLKKDGSFYVMSSDPTEPVRRIQKGITEALLCAECDNVRFGRNEQHLAQVVFGGHRLKTEVNGSFTVFSGYDYRKLKNALLSILWRMSVSSHPYFAEVDLGERHEKTLRMGLLNDAEFPEDHYPIMLTGPCLKEGDLGQLILPPDFVRMEGNRVYRCLISGLIFSFIVGSAALSDSVKKLMLRRDGWPAAKAGVENIPFLFDAVSQIGKAEIVRQKEAALAE